LTSTVIRTENDLTRRTVLGAGATALAAAVVAGPAPAEAAATRATTRAVSLYRRKRWAKQRRRSFLVTGPGVKLRMTLTAVRNIPHTTAGSQRSFELVFRASRRGPESGTFDLKRSRFARTSLFLVPTDETRRTYRATVNNR